jgi:hypothetical protein
MTDHERQEITSDPHVLYYRSRLMQSEIDFLKNFMFEQQKLNEALIGLIKTLGDATGALQIIEEDRAES